MAVAAPLASSLVRHRGWGLLEPVATVPAEPATTATASLTPVAAEPISTNNSPPVDPPLLTVSAAMAACNRRIHRATARAIASDRGCGARSTRRAVSGRVDPTDRRGAGEDGLNSSASSRRVDRRLAPLVRGARLALGQHAVVVCAWRGVSSPHAS